MSAIKPSRRTFESLTEEERAKKFLKYFNLRKGGQFHCLIKGCNKMFFVGTPQLTNHFKEEYIKKEGGEEIMAKKTMANAWKYDEVETVLIATFENNTEGQIKERLDNKRSTDAIKATVSKFFNYQANRNLSDISQPLQDYFKLFVTNNPNTIPVKVIIAETRPQETEEEVEKEVEEVLETATTFENLNKWFKNGGLVIMAHVRALVAEEVEQIKTESIRRLKEQQKELDELRDENKRLREVEKRYEKAKQAFA